MQVFTLLTRLRTFEKNHLPLLVTREDFELVRLIGLHEERGEPLLLKQLYLEGLASYATVTRRLMRLRRHGLVRAAAHGADRRAMSLTLDAELRHAYARYYKLLGTPE